MLETKCCKCKLGFQIRPSMAMLTGHNTGHTTCPRCKTFLHVEILEGNEAWTERWETYIAREPRGRILTEQHCDKTQQHKRS